MQYIKDVPLKDFDFVGDAEDNAYFFTGRQLDEIEDYLEHLGGMFTYQDINNMFIEHIDELAQILGYDTFEDMQNEYYDY